MMNNAISLSVIYYQYYLAIILYVLFDDINIDGILISTRRSTVCTLVCSKSIEYYI